MPIPKKEKNRLIKLAVHRAVEDQIDAILEKPFVIDFEIEHRWMVPFWKWRKMKKITIRPMTVETYFKILPLVVQFEDDDLGKITEARTTTPDVVKVMKKYSELVVNIVFIGLWNRPGMMPRWFRKFLMSNCTMEDYHIFLSAILYRMGVRSFYQSIMLEKRMSPMEQKEIIALQKNVETYLTLTLS